MKRYIKTGLILFILIFTVILSETIYANSDCTYPIFLDNKVVSKDAVPSILIDDKTYVPSIILLFTSAPKPSVLELI